jgi:prolyl oligopeptidase
MNRHVLLFVSCSVAACSSDRGAPAFSAPPPPPTRIATISETLHGVEVVENYRWLEQDNAEVAGWTEAQNQFTRRVLDNVPGRRALEERMRPLVQIGAVTAPIVRGNRYFYARRPPTQEQPVIYVRDGVLGAERVLLDPSTADASARQVTWLAPSEDGKLLAYGAYRPGDNTSSVRLLEVESLKPVPLDIANVLEAVQWLPDASGFIYHNLRDARDPDSRQGRFHRLGTPASADQTLYRQFTKAENPKLAQGGGPSGTISRDGRWLLLSYWLDSGTNDLWLSNFEEYRRQGARASRVVSVGANGRADGTVIGDTLLLHTTKGAPRGRVVAANIAAPDQAHWREIVPERQETIEGVAFGRGTVAVTYIRNASTAIEVFDFSGKALGTLSQPTIGSANLSASEDRTEAYLTFASFNYPPTIFRVDLATPGAAPKYWSGPEVPVDPATTEVTQVWYPSKDGTKISMFLTHKKGMVFKNDAPVLLSGYGAFSVSLVPMFAAPFLQWFDAGGVLAVPNLRGGGEYGEAWHRAGMLGKKKNGVDDLLAAAEWLIANKYTSNRRLALYGQSNGGLVAAAAMTERPDLFRAAVLGGPVLDMLRYHKYAREPYWAAEYGSADKPEQFKWLLAYSPYHRLKAGTKYPAVLLTAVDGESEVLALHARKMTAALQASSGSDATQQPVLLRVDPVPENPSALFDLELRDLVDQRLFLMWQLGMAR